MRSNIRNMSLSNNTLIEVPSSYIELEDTNLNEFNESDEIYENENETNYENENETNYEDEEDELPLELSDVFQTELIDNPSTLFILHYRGSTYYYFDEETKNKKKVLSIQELEKLEKCELFLSCPICMEDSDKNIKLPCKHVFCEECIKKWLLKNTNSCPNCRICVN